MSVQPKVGDIVTFRAEVVNITARNPFSTDSMGVKFIDCPIPSPHSSLIAVSRIHEHFPRTEPKIGETVWYDARDGMYSACPYGGQTLIHIHFDPEDHGKRKWGVVAFKGDIPKSVYFSDLRLTRECAA